MTHRSTSPRRALVAVAALSALAIVSAHAQTAAPAQAAETTEAASAPAPSPSRLTIRDVYDRVEAAGHRDLQQIEFEHDRYEVKAHDARDERVELKVDATSGAVEQERVRR